MRSGFSGRAAGYASDAAVWEAVRTQPGLAIVAGSAVRSREVEPAPIPIFRLGGVFREDARFEPTTVWVRDTRGGRTVKLTVIGVLDPRATFGNGLFTSAATLADAGVPPPTRTTTYLRVRPDVSAAEKTMGLNLSLGQQSLRASEIGEDVRRILGLRMLLNDLLQAFIGIGLLAGIAGLGVISMRAVVERRREIGMLRALGLTGRAVQAAFLLEASIVALLGIGVGVGLGIALASRLVAYHRARVPGDRVHGAVGADRRDRAVRVPGGAADDVVAGLAGGPGRAGPGPPLRVSRFSTQFRGLLPVVGVTSRP